MKTLFVVTIHPMNELLPTEKDSKKLKNKFKKAFKKLGIEAQVIMSDFPLGIEHHSL